MQTILTIITDYILRNSVRLNTYVLFDRLAAFPWVTKKCNQIDERIEQM